MRRTANRSLYGNNNRATLVADLVPRAIVGKSRLGLGDTGGAHTIFEEGWAIATKRLVRLGCSDHMVADARRATLEQMTNGLPLCESPVERTMLAALMCADYDGFLCACPMVHNPKAENLPRNEVVIVPQFAFVKYRFDFAVIGQVGDQRQIVAVECDGAEFHGVDRASKDRARDGYLDSWGIEVFRLSGSDIYQNSIMRAGEVAAHLSNWRRKIDGVGNNKE